MKLSTYHLHTTFCDGKNTAEEMLLRAIECGCAEIGFSGHSPVSGSTFSMPTENVPLYQAEIRRLKEKYKGKIKVYLGMEQDKLSKIDYTDYDYIIGSVHYLVKDGEMLPVDSSAEKTRSHVMNHYGGDAYAYCEDYFEAIGSIYEYTRCDIVGHYDVVAKFTEVDPLFSTYHPRYVAAKERAIRRLLDSGVVFEINTGGISRGYRTDTYPTREDISSIAALGGKFIATTDTHNVNTLDFWLDEVKRRLDEDGISYFTSMDEVLAYTRK